MKHLDEYREPEAVRLLLAAIRAKATRPWRIMEVCGGQTHSIVRSGIDQLMRPEIDLIHGPGCPVCVTPLEQIDRAVAIASRPGVIFCSFGDMLRVPGSGSDLLSAKAAGADVRAVYSPLDALELARRHPDREVVFFAVGFETTAPANGLAVWRAAAEGLGNFSALVSHVCVPPALEFLLTQPDVQIDAFLAAGHVCTVMGYEEYFPLVERFGRPIVVTGFETVDILLGVRMAVEQLEAGQAAVENQYARLVRREGNVRARGLIADVFEPCDRAWRGIGVIPQSGYRLREAYAAYDAERRFEVGEVRATESDECLSGLVLQGKLKPPECPAFGTRCTPERPLGAPMVSTEGACAAYYRYAQPAVSHG
jgi:hydrogenase expression/formation protein HypD